MYLELELPILPSKGSWLDRPLPKIMLHRAALDAHVLIHLKDRIEYAMTRHSWEALLWSANADN